MCSIGYPFYICGGQGSKVYSDIRKLTVDGTAIDWKIVRNDGDDSNFPESMRNGHSFHQIGQYFFIFGGVGPYSKVTFRKTSRNDLIVYDLMEDKYIEFNDKTFDKDETD